jgi:hypothetical protein
MFINKIILKSIRQITLLWELKALIQKSSKNDVFTGKNGKISRWRAMEEKFGLLPKFVKIKSAH